jgi:hypothetical protein
MTALRRKGLLLALTAAIAFGGGGSLSPASASFADSAVQTTSITTATVAAPTNLVGALACTSPDSRMSATWKASTTPRVTGYLVNVTFSDGYVQSVQLGAEATSWSAPIAKYNVTTWAIQYSVTTQVHGWTAESPKTGWFQCS